MVEFALLAPVLLLLMLLAVDFGRLFFTYIAVSNAAREGAYHASVHAADSSFDQASYEAAVAEAALREVNVQRQGGEGTITVSAPTCFSPASEVILACNAAAQFAGGSGNRVTVSVSQPFTFLTPLIGDVFGGQLTLRTSATAPVLNPLSAQLSDPETSCALADFTWATSDDSPLTVTFTDSSTGSPSSWSWDFGDDTETSVEQHPLHSYADDGWYPVTLSVDECGHRTHLVAVGAEPGEEPACIVPDFYHTYWNNVGGVPAEQVWFTAGFTGTLTDATNDRKIQQQTMEAGTPVPCTSNMTVSNN